MITFTFLGIPVRIQPAFWLFLLFFTNIYQDPSLEGVIIGIVMMGSLLIHEYGHALTAVYFGAKPTVTLEAFGGYASYYPVGMTRTQEFLVVLNGPLLQSVLIALSYYLLHSGMFASAPYVQYTLYVTMRLNILWVLFNLIPIAPLDGSKILHYFLEKFCGERADKIGQVIGSICVCTFAPYLFLQGYYFFCLYLVIMWYQNLAKPSLHRTRNNETSPFATLMKGIKAYNEENDHEAKQIFQTLIKSKDAYIKNCARESLAKLYFRQNDKNRAYDLLLNMDHNVLQEGKVLLCQLAFERGNFELVTRYAREIYTIQPTFEIALLNAKAFAHLRQTELSGGWLFTASQFGPQYRPQVQEALASPAFVSLSHHESIASVLATT